MPLPGPGRENMLWDPTGPAPRGPNEDGRSTEDNSCRRGLWEGEFLVGEGGPGRRLVFGNIGPGAPGPGILLAGNSTL